MLPYIADLSRIDLRLQARNDLQILRLVLVILLLNFGRLRTTLLLRLAHFHPLLHCQVLAQLGELIGDETETMHCGAVGDRVEDNVVVGTISWVSIWCSVRNDYMREISRPMSHTEQSIALPTDQQPPDPQAEHARDEHSI